MIFCVCLTGRVATLINNNISTNHISLSKPLGNIEKIVGEWWNVFGTTLGQFCAKPSIQH